MENKEYLKQLLLTPSPSGAEKDIIENVFNPYMKEFSTHECTDKMGNSAFSISDPSHSINKRVLISGHIDSIGLMVSHIKDSGILCISSNGGMDRRVLPGSLMDVILDDGRLITGIIGKKPIHVEEDSEYEKAIPLDKLTLDLGLSKEEVENLGIYPGTLAVFHRGLENLEFGNGDLICSPDLDDKIGVYITSEVMKRLGKGIPGTRVIGAAFTQEEVGLRGAKVMAKNLDPDISIDIDVIFETKDSELSEAKYGSVELGKGPVLEYGADKNRDLNKLIKKVAKDNNIDIQLLATRPGGTNTNAIQLDCKNCMTTHIAIPLKNMHTQVEVVSWKDVNSCIDLLVEVLKTL